MKRISTAIVLTILFAAGTHARTVAELFIAAPDGIFPLMGKNTRMDMVDYSTHSLPTMSETEPGGKTRIVEMDDRRLLAQAGTASSVEVAVLPMRSDTLLAVIETVLVPMADSSIRFFSTRTWQELPQKNATGMADFFQNGRIPDNPPRMLFAKISFDSESGHFVFTNTTASDYVESDAPASLPLMKTAIRRSFNGKSWKTVSEQ